MAQNQILSSVNAGSTAYTVCSFKDEVSQAYFNSFVDAPASSNDADKHQVSEFQLVNSEGQRKLFNLKDKSLGQKVNKFLNPKVFIAKKSIKVNTTRFSFPVLQIGIKYDQVLKSTLQ